MFAEDPKVTSEYVVVVDVHVDADRVEERLLESGLLRHKEGASATSKVTLEVRGLSDYRAYEAIRALLTEDMGARAAMPRGFKLGVALIDLELVGAANSAHASRAEEVAAWLVDQQSPELQFQALEVGDDRLVVTVDWTEPAADDPAPVGAWR